jgi:hypothetical protein
MLLAQACASVLSCFLVQLAYPAESDMTKGRRVSLPLIALAVAAGVCAFRQLTFVPPPGDRHARYAAPLSTASGAAAMFAVAPAAHADRIGDAAKNLADASYPLVEKIDWGRTPEIAKWLSNAQGWSAGKDKLAEAVESTLKLGLEMDPALIKASVAAHDTAVINAMGKPGLVTPLSDHEAVTESIARMLASAPAADIRAVFDTYAKVGLKSLNGQWYSTLDSGDVAKSYKAFLALKDEVYAAAPKAASTVSAAASNYNDKIGVSAKDLADAAYPLFKDIDWANTPVLTKWFSDSVAQWDENKLAAAMDAVLKLSVAMDSKLITQAVAVHDKAVLDALRQPGLVTTRADNEAVFESIARMFASAPDKVKPVFDAFAEVGIKDLNGAWFATMDKAGAERVFQSFQKLAQVVQGR